MSDVSLNGDKFWYLNGKRHREDGPAIEYTNGNKAWCINGKRHREDGPAVEYINGSSWYKNGLLHRVDGPALISYADNGDVACRFYINGELLNPIEYMGYELITEEVAGDIVLNWLPFWRG